MPDPCPMLRGNPPHTCHWCTRPLKRTKRGVPRRDRRWCSTRCNDAWAREHVWAVARDAAVARDNRRCVRRDLHEDEEKVRAELQPRVEAIEAEHDGDLYQTDRARWHELHDEKAALQRAFIDRIGARDLEVNHIVPRRGRGYTAGCHHHLANLETLCRPHHVEETTRQLRGWPSWRDDPRPLDEIARDPEIVGAVQDQLEEALDG